MCSIMCGNLLDVFHSPQIERTHARIHLPKTETARESNDATLVYLNSLINCV